MVEGLNNLTNKVDFRVDVSQNLTQSEQEVLTLLTDEFLTQKQIAIRRQCSIQAVNKIIKKLRKKGAFGIGLNKVEKNQPTIQPLKINQHQIRLHAQEFNINILYKDGRYKQILEGGNILNIDGNTIRLYRDSIEVYSGNDFYADDVNKATASSFYYWNRLFAKLEHEFKIIIVKPRAANIKLVNAHYAEINNELSQDCNLKAEKIKVYTNDDGKLWFQIDNSLNINEAEGLHPQTSKQDMGEVVKPFFNDLRDNKPPLSSELWMLLAQTNKLMVQETSTLHEFQRDVKIHNEVLKGINISFKRFNRLLSERQKKLGDWL